MQQDFIRELQKPVEKTINIQTAILSGKKFKGIVLTSDEEEIEEPKRPDIPGIIIIFLLITAGTWVLAGITYTFVKDSDTKVAIEVGDGLMSDSGEEGDRRMMREA